MFWKRRMTHEEAKAIVEAVEKRDERFRLTNELARTIYEEHLQAIENMTPGERALMRMILAIPDRVLYHCDGTNAIRDQCLAEATRIMKAREAATA